MMQIEQSFALCSGHNDDARNVLFHMHTNTSSHSVYTCVVFVYARAAHALRRSKNIFGSLKICSRILVRDTLA